MHKMKKRSILMGAIIGIIALTGCEKEADKIILDKSVAPELVNPDGTGKYVLTKENSKNTFETFIWDAADYGAPIVSKYTIQMDVAGGDFSNPISLKESTTNLYQSTTVEEFNQKLLDLGFTPTTEEVVQVRVQSTNDNPSINTLVSKPIQLTVTSYDATKVYPKLYMPGSYQNAGGYGPDWDPSNEKSVIYSVNENGKYEGYINFAVDNAEWKFSETPSWSGTDWGDGNSDGNLDKDGNITALNVAGYYQVKVDWSADPKPYSFTKTDWGVIGSATPGGWNTDTNMTWDAVNLNLTVTMDMTVGEFKFRANDAWDINYGKSDKDGIIGGNNDNIPINEAGNYTIVLDLSHAVYTYSITKN